MSGLTPSQRLEHGIAPGNIARAREVVAQSRGVSFDDLASVAMYFGSMRAHVEILATALEEAHAMVEQLSGGAP